MSPILVGLVVVLVLSLGAVLGMYISLNIDEMMEQKTASAEHHLLPGIFVEEYGDKQAREYHVRPLLTLDAASFPISKYENDGIPARVFALREALFLIPGINDVYIHPYAFTVTIAKAYTWDEVEANMTKTITKAYGWLITKDTTQ